MFPEQQLECNVLYDQHHFEGFKLKLNWNETLQTDIPKQLTATNVYVNKFIAYIITSKNILL